MNLFPFIRSFIPNHELALTTFLSPFPVCRLTAGRIPPTPHQLPPLLVLRAVSTQTPPTNLAALPAFTLFLLWSIQTSIFCSYFNFSPVSTSHTRLHAHFISTRCAGTQDSCTFIWTNFSLQHHSNAKIFVS